MTMPGLPELLVIMLIVLLLFGSRRLPELARSMGKSLTAFKGGLKDVEQDLASIQGEKPVTGREQSPTGDDHPV